MFYSKNHFFHYGFLFIKLLLYLIVVLNLLALIFIITGERHSSLHILEKRLRLLLLQLGLLRRLGNTLNWGRRADRIRVRDGVGTRVRPGLGNDGEAASHSVPSEDAVQRQSEAHLLAGDVGKSGGRSPGNQGPLVQTNLVLGCLTAENLRAAEDSVQVWRRQLHLQVWWEVRRSAELLSHLLQARQQLLAWLRRAVLRLEERLRKYFIK